VEVGQGSALSPVLLALYIALVMKLYHMQAVALKMSLLSYVDDGTVMAQFKLFVLVIVVIKHFEIGLVDIDLYIDLPVFYVFEQNFVNNSS